MLRSTLGPIGVGVKRHLPLLPSAPREFPAPPVGIGDGFCPFAPPLLREFGAQRGANRWRHCFQSAVQSLQLPPKHGFIFRENRVKRGVLGDAFKGDVRDGFVDESGRDACRFVLEFVVVETRCQEALAR